MKNVMKIKMEWDITLERLADMFVGAIEGNAMVRAWVCGIYWQNYDTPWPPNETEPGVVSYADPKLYERSDFKIAVHEYDETEWNGDCAPDGIGVTVHTITINDVLDGLTLMAAKYPGHWEDLVSENDDNITADVMLQMVVLKKVVYG